jgi:AcrR family transcriptional regulator
MREGTSLRDCASLEHHMALGGCDICSRLRTTLLAALADADLQGLEAEEVAARAGLSIAGFGEHYRTLDDCLLDAFDRLADDLHEQFEQAFQGSGDWHGRLALGMGAALTRLQSIPGATQLWFLEAPRTSDRLLQEHRAAARDRLVETVTQPEEDGWDSEVPGLHAEFLIGALARAGHDELATSGDCTRAVARVRELLAVFEPLPA